jgi:hypothetical protein
MPLGCYFVSDSKWISRTTEVISTLRRLGFDGRCGVLFIDSPSVVEMAALRVLSVGTACLDADHLQKEYPRTGLKLLMPHYFVDDYYVLLDSDLMILSLAFLDHVGEDPDRIAAVVESDVRWRIGKKGIGAYHRVIVGKRVIQTGLIAFARSHWLRFFPAVWRLAQNEPSDFGDMVAINIYIRRNPGQLRALGEEDCLVLRPNLRGSSSKNHLPFVRLQRGRILYKGRPVSVIHCTNSGGARAEFRDIVEVLKRPRGIGQPPPRIK